MFKDLNKYNFSRKGFQNFIQNDSLVSGGHPLSVGTPIRWYDAMNIDAGGVDWNTMLVSSWNDLMGNDNLVQSTLANKPSFNPIGINQKPAVSFLGTDVLSGANLLGLTSTSHTLYAVIRRITASAVGGNIETMLNRGIMHYLGAVTAYGGSVSTYQEPCPTAPASYMIVAKAVFNTGISVYVNSLNTKAPYTFTGTDTDQSLRIEGTTNNELYGEIILYDKAHTDAQRLVVENYLKNKWGIL